MSLSKKQLWIVGGVVTGLVVVVVLFLVLGKNSSTPDSAVYQAVFLDNDRVYFGHLQRADSDFFLLTDVYYVESVPVPAGQAPQSKLIRLGAVESHGPENMMMIEKNHIRIWENLRPNSPLVQAILNLKLQTR